ncbi:MAG TPA: hypothetical protein VLG50_07485 [Candidatus Saccharimonadales bacterium]|nr:hypothetical protein [Candidatus Saccharimonadales bacterium]
MSGKVTKVDLLNQLQSYSQYQNMSKHYIDKALKAKYNLKTIKNVDYAREIESLKQPMIVSQLQDDPVREILLHADIDTIKRYCSTHKKAQLLCQDKGFWREKYRIHNFYFPVILDDEQTYMKLFDFMSDEIKNVKIILKINDIEKNRQYNKTKGIIVVRIEDMLADNLDDLLSSHFQRDKDGDMMFNDMVFTLTDKGYHVKLTNIKNVSIDVGYKTIQDVEKLFTYAIMLTGIVDDDLNIIFNSMDDDAFDEDDIREYYRETKKIIRASLRRGLWEGILNK